MRLMERDAQGQSRAATSAAQIVNNAVSQYVTSMLKLCLEAALFIMAKSAYVMARHFSHKT